MVMLPLGDDNSGRRIIPFVTYALIALNVLVFVLVELPQQDLEGFINQWGTVPSQIGTTHGMLTLLTSMFLHGGWLHIGSNMLFLWIFGDNVEDAFGHILYLGFYLLCGIAASLAQVFMNLSSEIPGVGASGAIAGVLAGYIVMFGNRPVRALVGRMITNVPAYVMIGLWIATQFLSVFSGQEDGVAYWAHIGGFIAGLLLTFVWRGVARPTLGDGGNRPVLRS
jgi:membrane associated rhomboid family serine protease